MLTLLLTGFVTASVSMAGALQDDQSRARSRLTQAPPLSGSEVLSALSMIRAALANVPFRVAVGRGSGQEYLMDSTGRLRLVRDGALLTEFTGRPAVYCDGSAAPGHLVVEYRHTNERWSATARPSLPIEPGPMFEMLYGILQTEDGGLTQDGRERVLNASWKPRRIEVDGTLPNGRGGFTFLTDPSDLSAYTVTLVFDTTSLRPLRWEVTVHATASPQGVTIPYLFQYDAIENLRAPEQVLTRSCIDPRSPFR